MMETKGREWCVSTSGSQVLTAVAVAVLVAGCGGGDVADDARRSSLSAVSAASTPVYDRDDLYRFFAIAFSAAPGVTYMGQLVEAADYGLSIKQIVNIFTTKPQFLETYPASLSNREYAQKLVDNVVGTSATAAAKAEAVEDIVAALSLPDWTRSLGNAYEILVPYGEDARYLALLFHDSVNNSGVVIFKRDGMGG